jgi:transcriptional regulator with XRE-family HTH domain
MAENPIEPDETIGERIHRLRRRQNLTLEELAKRARARTSSLSRYERDQREMPFRLAGRVADVLGVSVGYLLDGRQSPSSLSPAA